MNSLVAKANRRPSPDGHVDALDSSSHVHAVAGARRRDSDRGHDVLHLGDHFFVRDDERRVLRPVLRHGHENGGFQDDLGGPRGDGLRRPLRAPAASRSTPRVPLTRAPRPSQNSAWVLRTRREFLLAFTMIMLVAALSEALGYERRLLRQTALAAKGRGAALSAKDRALIAIAFTIHITLGYLLMLCAMTYQVELLFAVSVGLGLGHFVFNADTNPSERIDPCCGDEPPATEKSPLMNA